MSWKIIVESHQCVYRVRAHPHFGIACYNNKNKSRGDCVGDCAESVCPLADHQNASDCGDHDKV